ncbi:MAG: hypothetical protein ACLS37_08285 [Alistipes sp.]
MANKFQNVYMLHNAGNDAYYYSFSAQLHKRFRFGLDLAVAYTRSGGKVTPASAIRFPRPTTTTPIRSMATTNTSWATAPTSHPIA